MIMRLTYLSGPYKVKAYLGLPRGCGASPEAVQAAVAAAHGLPAESLPVELVASTWLPPADPDGPSAVASTAPAPAPAPAGTPPRFPALVLCRGGLGNVGRVRPHWVDAFAARGFALIAPCYRGNEGGEGRDEFGGADREDVAAAIRLVRALPWTQAGPVAAAGFSRGAINAARAAADMPDDVDRLILWSGVADLARTYEERVDLRRMLKRLLGGSPAKRPGAYRERSPLHLADRLRCKALVVHGAKDAQVDAGHGDAMFERLRALGVPAEQLRFEEFGHHFPYGDHEALLDRMSSWLRK